MQISSCCFRSCLTRFRTPAERAKRKNHPDDPVYAFVHTRRTRAKQGRGAIVRNRQFEMIEASGVTSDTALHDIVRVQGGSDASASAGSARRSTMRSRPLK
jgi:hypothetical protein